MTSEHEDRLLTGEEVQELLQVSRTTLYELRRAGKITKARDCRHLRFSEAEVARFIREQTATAPA